MGLSTRGKSRRALRLHGGGRQCTRHLLITLNACIGCLAISHVKRRVLHTRHSCCGIPTDVTRIGTTTRASLHPLLPRTRAVWWSHCRFHSCCMSREHHSRPAARPASNMGKIFFQIHLIPLFASLLAISALVMYPAQNVSTPAPLKPLVHRVMIRAWAVCKAWTVHALVPHMQ